MHGGVGELVHVGHSGPRVGALLGPFAQLAQHKGIDRTLGSLVVQWREVGNDTILVQLWLNLGENGLRPVRLGILERLR